MVQIILLPDASRNGDSAVVLDHFPFVLGRSSQCDHAVGDLLVSRRHCRFFLAGDRVWVQDLESLNGTYVNGEPLPKPLALHDGDELRLGSRTFRVAVHSLENVCARQP